MYDREGYMMGRMYTFTRSIVQNREGRAETVIGARASSPPRGIRRPDET